MARKKNLERRRIILGNSFNLIKRYGVENVSLQMIADESGISKSLLQSYYSHKSVLTNDLLHNIMATIFSQLKNEGIDVSSEFAAMHALITSILEIGVSDSGIYGFIKSIIENGSSLDRWIELISDWLKEEGIQEAFGSERDFRTGLRYMVAGGGSLYVKRIELELTSRQIGEIMVRNFLSTFIGLDKEQVDRTVTEGNALIASIDMNKVMAALNEEFKIEDNRPKRRLY